MGRDSSPAAGTSGVGTTSAASGFIQLVRLRDLVSGSRSAPERPRTRERVSTTHTRDERRPMMARKRSISSDGT